MFLNNDLYMQTSKIKLYEFTFYVCQNNKKHDLATRFFF